MPTRCATSPAALRSLQSLANIADGCPSQKLQHPSDVLPLSRAISDRNSDAVPPPKASMRDEKASRRIHLFEQFGGRFFRSSFIAPNNFAKHHDAERLRSEELDVVALRELIRKLLGIRDVIANRRPNPIGAVMLHHHPQLQRAESAAELQTIIHVVYFRRIGGLQILGNQRKGVSQHVRPPRVKNAAVDRREEPFVRID